MNKTVDSVRKVFFRREQGITLVALIITIIVLIIMAAVTIKGIFDSNFINTAINGIENYTIAQKEELKGMDNTAEYVQDALNRLEGNGQSVPDNPDETPDIKPDPTPEIWITPTLKQITLLTGWVENKVIAVEDVNGEKVPIPIGFTPSDNADESKVETGLVIKQEGTNNEFVWVPCDIDTFGTLYTFSGEVATPIEYSETGYREPDILRNKTYGDASWSGINQLKTVVGIVGENDEEVLLNWERQIKQEYNDMLTSVKTYGGFYIGRYETGNLNEDKVAVVEKGNREMSQTNWYKAYKKSKTIAEGTDIQSSMIWGCQWDATMKWFLSSTDSSIRKYVTDSTGKGNYENTNGNTIISTGKYPKYAVNNIYDMAGNVSEWTLEANMDYTRILRGGHYGYGPVTWAVSSRYYIYPYDNGVRYGSRVTLVI